ncbi:hypothetical protein JAAARDRAFT_140580 [Jaapia argillacea MUCL 33604]|uniref:Uncharacterized protein n=1 Tax=Jaapia argillacea MUCL 33604 TaxID=933084 RepID=A0A067PJP0_9AGAM|nr:hypothetical protein JAAARDRAFT_140580 [Jaapia argillacea MUCL 33604]
MSLKFFLTIATIIMTAFAQTISIGAPADGLTVSSGSNITIEVDRPNSISGSKEVAIVIALRSCNTGGCIDPASALGIVLYTGPYNPQYSSPPDQKPPHQNFSVQVPTSFTPGKATLSVTHLALIGAGPTPMLEFLNVTVNVA